MKCLIDGDILLYEVGFKGQYVDEETGEIIPRDFDTVAGYLDEGIRQIEEECWATEESDIFLTGSTNFRNDIAVTKKYKDRPSSKPFHYRNLKAYLKANYNVKWQEGLEADDLMAIAQTEDTIICTRDKDLRMVEGMHFGWACGKQPQFGPENVSKLGSVDLVNKELKGTGLSFFYAQVITGDSVDTIPGLPGKGAAFAYKILKDCTTEEEMCEAVKQAYTDKYGEEAEERMLEQARLLWMVRELDEDGQPIMWEFP